MAAHHGHNAKAGGGTSSGWLAPTREDESGRELTQFKCIFALRRQRPREVRSPATLLSPALCGGRASQLNSEPLGNRHLCRAHLFWASINLQAGRAANLCVDQGSGGDADCWVLLESMCASVSMCVHACVHGGGGDAGGLEGFTAATFSVPGGCGSITEPGQRAAPLMLLCPGRSWPTLYLLLD
jgi:hypothetical protein